MPSLLVLYFFIEVLIFVAFALLLHVTSGVSPNTIGRCLVASIRAVTGLAEWDPEQFSFLEGGESTEQLSAAGAMILLFEGYLHFLFVCIASSLIIMRALRPLQQVAFSHHCVLSEEEMCLTLRIRVLRPKTTVLVHPEVRLDVCNNSGTFIKLPLVGGGTYAKWSGNPTITIRHIIDKDSPFYDGETGKPSLANIVHVSCSLVAQDANGTAVSEVQHYTKLAGFIMMIMGAHLEAVPGMRQTVPQILPGCKFEDQINFRTATLEELADRNPMKILGVIPHPHGNCSNIRKHLNSKRLVTNNDTFNRIVYEDSALGRQSSAVSHVIKKHKLEQGEKEKAEKEERDATTRNTKRV
eukprot:CAMPEP_0118641780 /NCGR_PEP_ID=MMETSP0785-20121206/5482_1 /TAXON_ID=91992 /ORGANISM="Bolidomonas pacifica, Strain CCMP 1866" /LENGTH=353 /DNA_ID=CAMNT_0006533283 /DNA_START=175 /DNA_END=1232 /DNA_ORIENTATION=-